MVILGTIWMLHSQASLVILLKIKTSVVAFLILLYHLVCWLGSKSSKVQKQKLKKINMGGEKTTISLTIEIMYQQSQTYTMYMPMYIIHI